ncbi:MAG: enoyl-CoA hydratase/isomerase family protein [Armatimonadetes bacterium]|nr:enoyl-CoA hydratase/isomerase family protein [Armatimonadota bacterium]
MLNVEEKAGWLKVALNRPEVRNAFDDSLIGSLTALFADLDPAIRAVLVTGEGPVFCAGGDLNWMRKAAGYTEEQNAQDALKLAGLFESIATSRAVVVTAVHGAAFGGGCGLVAAADVAVAAEGCKFSFSEVRLGLVPATISPFVIPKTGAGHARALFTTGEVFDSEKALRIGLVHDVCPLEELESQAKKKIADVLRNGPESVALCKKLAAEAPLGKEESSRLLARARAGAEGKEGVAAFLEKRPASFVQEVVD